MTRWFLTLLLLFSAPMAAANDRACEALLQSTQFLVHEGVPKNFVKSMQKLIPEINAELLGPSLKAPSLKGVEIFPELDYSQLDEEDAEEDFTYMFEYHNSKIVMSRQMIGMNGHKKSIAHSRINFVHEYGHAILDANLSASPELQEYFEKMKQKGDMQTELHELLFTKEVLLEGVAHVDGARNQVLNQKLTELDDEIKMKGAEAAILNMSMDSIPLEIFEAYGELYADLVAVLFYEDGRAMHKALYFKGDDNDRIQYRDFTTGLNLGNWEPNDGIHETLLPTRTFLWETYLKDGQVFSQGKKAQFLAAVTDALVKHVHKRITTPELQSSTAQSRNEWLIEDLKNLKF